MSFSNPEEVIQELKLEPGEVVAELGSGIGLYSLAAAKAVGEDGKVYAIDVQKELLARLKAQSLAAGLKNVEVIWGDIERVGGSGLGDHKADAAIIANVLFQAKASYQVALETKRILKSGGRVLIVDWKESFGGLGPRPEDVVSAEQIKKVFGEAGFAFDREFPAGDNHWGMILRKQK